MPEPDPATNLSPEEPALSLSNRQDRVGAAIRQIAGFAEHVEPKQRIDMIVDDPTDNRILECAATSGSDYLVSGDHHLLKVGQYQGCKIATPAEFLEIQSQRGRER
jgi:predicted nucleic acid-binding protein